MRVARTTRERDVIGSADVGSLDAILAPTAPVAEPVVASPRPGDTVVYRTLFGATSDATIVSIDPDGVTVLDVSLGEGVTRTPNVVRDDAQAPRPFTWAPKPEGETP
jgi:hypothetical protein